MRTLVERTISAYGAEGDDAFRSADIVEFLNGAYERTVASLTNLEKTTGRTLRCLDQLRHRKELPITEQGESENGYQIVDVPMPDDLLDAVHASYIDSSESRTVRMRELATEQLVLLEMGTAKPNWMENFYHITSNGGGPIFEVFALDVRANSDKLRVYYILKPDKINEESIELPNLPKYLTDAVIYGACEKMALKMEDDSAEKFRMKHMSEIQTNAV